MSTVQSMNLVYQRATGNVWHKRGWHGVTIEERLLPWLVGVAGAAALTYGAKRRSWQGPAYTIGGLTMWTCATLGMCNPRYASARIYQLRRKRRRDQVMTQSMHSFPASDPPSFTSCSSTCGDEYERAS
jgi:hypothetical protein